MKRGGRRVGAVGTMKKGKKGGDVAKRAGYVCGGIRVDGTVESAEKIRRIGEASERGNES